MKKLLFYTFWMFSTSVSFCQIKNESTGKVVDFNALLHGWEKYFSKFPEQYVWGGGYGENILRYIEKNDTNYYTLPFDGEESFIEVKEFKITNKDSTVIVSYLFEDEPFWASQIIKNYSKPPYSYRNIYFKFSGTLTVSYMPYVDDFYYIEMSASAVAYGAKKGEKEQNIYDSYIPLRGFVKKDKINSLELIFNSMVGGKPPYNINPSILENTSMSLRKMIYISEEDKKKIVWGK